MISNIRAWFSLGYMCEKDAEKALRRIATNNEVSAVLLPEVTDTGFGTWGISVLREWGGKDLLWERGEILDEDGDLYQIYWTSKVHPNVRITEFALTGGISGGVGNYCEMFESMTDGKERLLRLAAIKHARRMTERKAFSI